MGTPAFNRTDNDCVPETVRAVEVDQSPGAVADVQLGGQFGQQLAQGAI